MLWCAALFAACAAGGVSADAGNAFAEKLGEEVLSEQGIARRSKEHADSEDGAPVFPEAEPECICHTFFNLLFKEGRIEEASTRVEESQSPCSHFYKYFLHRNFFLDSNTQDALQSLVVSLSSRCRTADLAKLTYATNISERVACVEDNVLGAKHYHDIAKRIYEGFFQKRTTLFTKWEFEDLDKEGENRMIISFIKTLTKDGDSSAAEHLLSLIKTGHLEAAQNIDVLKGFARQGRSDAMGILGEMYLHGWGVPKSRINATHYFSEGAKDNDQACLNGLGLISKEEGNLLEAQTYFEKAARFGSGRADFNLFLLHEQAKNVMADIHLFRSAKRDGYLPAVFKYGEKCLESGDYHTAVHQFKSISAHFEMILDLERDAIESFKAGRHKQAFYTSLLIGDLGPLIGYRNACFLLKRQPKAIENCEKHMFILNSRLASKGSTRAMIALGDAYYHGRGVEVDRETSFAKYLEASLYKDPESYYLLGFMYEHGIGTEKNTALALQNYRKMLKRNPSTYLLMVVLLARLYLKMFVGWLGSKTLLFLFTALLGLVVAAGSPARTMRVFEGIKSTVKRLSLERAGEGAGAPSGRAEEESSAASSEASVEDG